MDEQVWFEGSVFLFMQSCAFLLPAFSLSPFGATGIVVPDVSDDDEAAAAGPGERGPPGDGAAGEGSAALAEHHDRSDLPKKQTCHVHPRRTSFYTRGSPRPPQGATPQRGTL